MSRSGLSHNCSGHGKPCMATQNLQQMPRAQEANVSYDIRTPAVAHHGMLTAGPLDRHLRRQAVTWTVPCGLLNP